MIEPLIYRLERFGPLSDNDKSVLARIGGEACAVAARTELVSEGNAPECMFLILQGFACRYKTTAQGDRQIIAYVLPGDFCDVDVALLSRMDHSIGTLSECHVVRIAADTIRKLLQSPALARAFRMATLVEIANAREWIVNVGRRSATVRIAHLICELHARLEMVGLTVDGGFDMPLTQIDLAETTGMSCVHMNRSIKELKDGGLIKLRRRHLTILDVPGLRMRAGFRPTYLHLDDAAA